MKIFGIPYQRRQVWYLMFDVLTALVAVRVGNGLVLGWSAPGAGILGIVAHSTGASLFFVSTSLILLYLADGYNATIDFRRRYDILRLWTAVAASLPLQFLVYAVFPHGWWGRDVAFLISLSFGVLLTLSRAALCALSPRPTFRQRTLIVGAGQAGHLLARAIRDHQDHGSYDIIGLVDQPRAGNRRRGDYRTTSWSRRALRSLRWSAARRSWSTSSGSIARSSSSSPCAAR